MNVTVLSDVSVSEIQENDLVLGRILFIFSEPDVTNNITISNIKNAVFIALSDCVERLVLTTRGKLNFMHVQQYCTILRIK